MIGLNQALNKHKKSGNVGLLNKLGSVDNAVFIFSPYERLVTSFNSPIIKIQRTSDYTSQWFYFKGNGLLDINEILTFVGSGDGLVEEITNQYANGNNAIQTILASKPKIVVSGVFQEDGILFDGSDDYFNIDEYSEIQIISPELTIFVKAYNAIENTGYFISKNLNSSADAQYALLNFTAQTQFKLDGIDLTTTYQTGTFEHIMGVWKDKLTDGKILKTNMTDVSATYSNDLTYRPYLQVGCRSNSLNGTVKSAFLNASIKSIVIFNSNEYDKYYELCRVGNEPLITVWDTENVSAGSSNSDQIKLPLESDGQYNFLVDWGDGSQDTITAYDQAEVTHTYSVSGQYEVKIYGELIGWRFNNDGDRLKLLDISRWGDRFKLGDNSGYFYGCSNLSITATNELNTNYMTNFSSFFRHCSNLNFDLNFSDTSNVNTLSAMFYGCVIFNGNINSLNTEKVTTTNTMFYNCYEFNQSVENFDTALNINMSFMFYNCYKFNQSVENFDTSNVANMYAMFYNCYEFNQNIESFNFESVTNVQYILNNATSFSRENYDLLLISLSSQTLTPSLVFNCASYYTLGGSAETARNDLINNDLWVMNDLGGLST